MGPSRIIDRLHAIQRAARRRLLAYGVCTVLVVGVFSFLAAVTLDWLLWLPKPLRVIFEVAIVVGFAVAAVHWIVAPLRARLDTAEVAGLLEQHFTELRDRLTSTVHFLERSDAGSPSMTGQVIAETDEMVRDIPLEAALRWRPLVVRGALLAVGIAIWACISVTSPTWARTGIQRLAFPLEEVEWPRRVSIVPLTGAEMVGLGESVRVRMVLERGWHDRLRAIVCFREPGGEVTTRTMQRDPDGTFYATIDSVTQDLEYWFEAGDDSTKARPLAIRAVRRPEIVEALLTIEPPPYAAWHASSTHDLRDGPVRACLGGYARVDVRASKAIPQDPSGMSAGIRFETGEVLPLAVHEDDPLRLSARFEVTESTAFRIELRDQAGFENRGAAEYSILALPDAAPTVTIIEPRSVVELTPRGSLPLAVRVEDDFGITRLDLEVDRPGADEAYMISLTDRLVTVSDHDGIESLAAYTWSVEPLSLSPGDEVLYAVAATDNRATESASGQVSRSPSQRLKIITEVEFEIRLRNQVAVLERRVRRALLDEADLLDRTRHLLGEELAPADPARAQRREASALSTEQARLVRQLRDLSQRFARLRRRIEHNAAGDGEMQLQIASAGKSLQEIATGPMTSAGEALSGAAEHDEAAALKTALAAASREEQVAVDRLRGLLRALSHRGDFQELITTTRDLAEQQDAVRTRTGELGKSMLGKSVASLTKAEAGALKRLERRQEQLAIDVDHLMERMKSLRDSTREQDPAGADAMDASLRAGRARDLTKRLRAAVGAISANRTAAAAMDQRTAAEALRKMGAALGERAGRELERLRKQLQRAEELVAKLIEAQQALRDATQETAMIEADGEVFAGLEREQRTLGKNTRLLGEELGDMERTVAAGDMIRFAAAPMKEAETQLGAHGAERAADSQDEALALLGEALMLLEKLALEAEELALRRTLAEIREALETVRASQLGVNEGIELLREAIGSRGRVSRSEARQASKLAREQAGVRELLDDLLGELEQVPVYAWALQRVTGWMDTSRRLLSRREIDEGLVRTTQRIVGELGRLIGAIVEAEALPMNTEFADAGGGGGGAGGMIISRPVPTIAELFVLKAMQIDIGRRTTSLDETLDIQNAAEEQLHELKTLAEDQAEVRRLTEMVTAQARNP